MDPDNRNRLIDLHHRKTEEDLLVMYEPVVANADERNRIQVSAVAADWRAEWNYASDRSVKPIQ